MAQDAITPQEERRGASGWLLLHCFAGPSIGTVVFTALMIANSLVADPLSLFQRPLGDVAMIPVALLFFLLPGWFLGFIPALAHAVAMLLLRRVVPSRMLWLALTPLIGWVVVFLPLLAIAGFGTFDKIFDSAMLSLVGSAAAIGCMAIAWKRGMYPVALDGKSIPAP